MDDSSEIRLNQVIEHFRTMEVPDFPAAAVDVMGSDPVKSTPPLPRRRSAPFAVALALGALIAVALISFVRRTDLDKPETPIAQSQGTKNPNSIALAANQHTGGGLIFRSRIQLARVDPKEQLILVRQDLQRLEVELEDLENRASLLHVRDQVEEIAIALSRLVASSR